MDLERDFNITQFQLTPDYEGRVVTTLISAKNNIGNRKSILYIHGYIDYFFHPHVAEEFLTQGYDFYALDLRKYGRSMLEHQKPNYCENIEEYFEDITTAIDHIKEQKSEKIFLLGHSTGGLTTSSYMNYGERKDDIVGLILNSPFLEMNQPPLLTKVAYSSFKQITKIKADACLKRAMSPLYAKSIHNDHEGCWEFKRRWKPIAGFPMYFKWFIAIVDTQRKLASKSNIQVPLLLLHAEKSIKAKKFEPHIMSRDAVLNVEDMKRIGPKLGKDVTLLSVKKGIHDIFLSPKYVRDKAFKAMFEWLNKY